MPLTGVHFTRDVRCVQIYLLFVRLCCMQRGIAWTV